MGIILNASNPGYQSVTCQHIPALPNLDITARQGAVAFGPEGKPKYQRPCLTGTPIVRKLHMSLGFAGSVAVDNCHLSLVGLVAESAHRCDWSPAQLNDGSPWLALGWSRRQ